jgi:hypothetical protein
VSAKDKLNTTTAKYDLGWDNVEGALLCLKFTPRGHRPLTTGFSWPFQLLLPAPEVISGQLAAIKQSPEWYFYVPYDNSWNRFLRNLGHTFAIIGNGETVDHCRDGKRGGEFEYVA